MYSGQLKSQETWKKKKNYMRAEKQEQTFVPSWNNQQVFTENLVY